MSDLIISIFNAAQEIGYIDEPISQYQHGLQAGYYAKQLTNNPKTHIAALLHDIGHLINGDRMISNDGIDLGAKQHEKQGANFLRSIGLDDEICQLVENHVNAKRYLCTKFKSYIDKLSEASYKTLFEHQGGLMNDEELELFENNPLFQEFIILRKCDELSKEINFTYNEAFENYKELIESFINKGN